MAAGKDISRGLRRAYMAMHRQTQLLLSSYEVTADQYVLLALLSLQDGMTQNELTSRASSDPNTIRAMLVLLESKRLVIRKPHEIDRRARRVLLTAKGSQLYSKLAAALKPLQDALLSPFNAQESDLFLEGLRRVENAMRQWELAQKPLIIKGNRSADAAAGRTSSERSSNGMSRPGNQTASGIIRKGATKKEREKGH